MVLLVPSQDLGDFDLAVREDCHTLAQHVHMFDVRVVLPSALLHRGQKEECTTIF